MKKVTLLLLSILAFSGCTHQNVSQEDITAAEDLCLDSGGIRSIRVSALGTESVICMTNHTYMLHIGEPVQWTQVNFKK